MPFSTSSIRTSLPNSLGLWALPLRMTSVWGSNRLNTLSSTWLFPFTTRSLVCRITFSQRKKVPQLANLGCYSQDCAHHFQPSLPPPLHHFAGLSHDASSQSQQLLVTVAHPLLVGFGEGLGGTADFQQTMFHRAPAIDHFQSSGLALVGNALQAAAEHANAVAQNRTVGRIVNVAFHNRSVGSNFFALGYAMLAGQADHALMNLGGDGRTQQSKAATEDSELRGDVGIEAGEAAVHQVAAQFPFQSAEAPAFQVLHDTAAQQTIGGHAPATGTSRTGATFGQTLANQVD